MDTARFVSGELSLPGLQVHFQKEKPGADVRWRVQNASNLKILIAGGGLLR